MHIYLYECMYVFIYMYLCIFVCMNMYVYIWIVQALDQGAVEGAIDVPSDGSGSKERKYG